MLPPLYADTYIARPHSMRHTAAELPNIAFALTELTCESAENQGRPAKGE
jgi:hypothetical protein